MNYNGNQEIKTLIDLYYKYHWLMWTTYPLKRDKNHQAL